MPHPLTPGDLAKSIAARRACDYVEDGMKVGLGTGSTAAFMVRHLGQLVADGLRVTCVPTSARTGALARSVGLQVVTLDEARWLDLTIDGADEFDRDFNLIKGGGGALLHEKIVAAASERMVVIADPSKRVETLGAFPLPVEAVAFGLQSTRAAIAEILASADVLNRSVTLRMEDDAPYATDEGNRILDLDLGRIGDARRLSIQLNQIPGVVENGLFCDLCDIVVVGHPDGRIELRDLANGTVIEERAEMDEPDNIFAESGD
ncbi:ribose 5-phosphate isomerase [Oceaniovalibus guishaninsula JLT2003]|uniref:Ribose-5-phosphate isomerase A n=1 Tax=Oceaniovalibus guishaninsula JLT2003 TaxID=1231392 RepID=K2HCR3_9RHOB|nr:ribose-5-phosphate isomerase RpiA [Oceaniovalibus guishaninsula]EKE44392.1 ribose 5-phosphate isomerase [Oceaniovalibus guishaninsula JLT2003]